VGAKASGGRNTRLRRRGKKRGGLNEDRRIKKHQTGKKGGEKSNRIAVGIGRQRGREGGRKRVLAPFDHQKRGNLIWEAEGVAGLRAGKHSRKEVQMKKTECIWGGEEGARQVDPNGINGITEG